MIKRRYLKYISEFYSDVDEGHGLRHITTCLNVAEVGFKKDYEISKKYDEDFVLFTVMMHDCGLSRNNLKKYLKMNVSNMSDDEIREAHHINGPKVYAEVMKRMPYSEQDVADGIIAISEHRASVKQTTPLSNFLRSCDGLNTAEFILWRSYQYNYAHSEDKSLETVWKNARVHLYEKYCGPNPYCKELPCKWANEEFKREVAKLKKYLDSCTDEELMKLAGLM